MEQILKGFVWVQCTETNQTLLHNAREWGSSISEIKWNGFWLKCLRFLSVLYRQMLQGFLHVVPFIVTVGYVRYVDNDGKWKCLKGKKGQFVVCRRHFTLVRFIAAHASVPSVLAWIGVSNFMPKSLYLQRKSMTSAWHTATVQNMPWKKKKP